jgi:hypothetical protein
MWNSVLRSHRDVIDIFWEPKTAVCFLHSGHAGGSLRMTSANDFRRYAAECVVLAQQMSDPADKAHMLQMAQAWRELAEKQEAKAAKDDKAAPESDLTS